MRAMYSLTSQQQQQQQVGVLKYLCTSDFAARGFGELSHRLGLDVVDKVGRAPLHRVRRQTPRGVHGLGGF
jgi:hypothetical protein